MTTDPIARYRHALEQGSDEARSAWAATGLEGLRVLRADLSGQHKIAVDPATHPRDVLDNLAAAIASIAGAHPDAFLEVFADPRLDELVLNGLGQIDDPRATERLARAAASESEWTRMDAAIGLGRRADPLATSTLCALLGDREYLVRYHTLKSLAAIGNEDALEALRGYAQRSPIERTLAAEAILAIESRVSGDQPTG